MAKKKQKTLVVTSWSRDYACAASMALIRYPDADLRTASLSYLPRLMEKLVGSRKSEYARIIILGISLEHDPEELAAALKRLEPPVLWISIYPMSERTSEALDGLLTTYVVRDKPLHELVREALEIGLAEGTQEGDAAQRVRRIAGDGYNEEIDLFWRRVIVAAAARFRKRREDEPYAAAIRDIISGIVEDRHRELVREHDQSGNYELIGTSPWTRGIRLEAARIGEGGLSPVLIVGEPGTGKELLARHIHDCSDRLGAPFVVLPCCGLSDGQCDELFSGEDGPTGETPGRVFLQAAGGTLVLDGVDDLSLHGQAVLASHLEPDNVSGDKGGAPAVIAIARHNPAELVETGEFRSDLYWRLTKIELRCPPLRERMEDAVALVNHYLYISRHPVLDENEIRTVRAYNWPGNVWQVKSVVDRIVALQERDFAGLLGAEAAKHAGLAGTFHGLDYVLLPASSVAMEDVTREHMNRVFRMCNESYAAAAKTLGVSVNTLKKRLLE